MSRHPYDPNKLENFYPGDRYETQPRHVNILARLFTYATFYTRVYLGTALWLNRKAAKGQCDDLTWSYGSYWVREEAERVGMRFFIEGLDIINNLDGPVVFVGNHMSTMETFILPSVIRPRRPVTFVVKRSLTTMPGFGPIMRSRDPVVVDRVNPREDLKAILEQGTERLAKGISIIVFPQSTRRRYIEAEHFNTIGVKLARRAGVPVVPLALKTDAWGSGRLVKEMGPLTVNHDVLFRFFPPLTIKGNGHAEHKAILETISHTLRYWELRQDFIDIGKEPRPVIEPDFTPPYL